MNEKKLYCRTCLIESDNTYNPPTTLIPLNHKNLIGILEECTSVHVDEPEQMICEKCQQTLLQFFDFRVQCIRNDEIIRKIKDEPQDASNQNVCTHCQKCFTSKKTYELHTLTHNITCTECGDTSETHEQRHDERDEKRACEKCVKCRAEFPDRAHLAEHFRAKHERNRCGVCGKHFNGLTFLRRHLLKHVSPNDDKSALDNLDDDDNPKKYACVKCPKKFLKKRYLQIHMSKHTSIKNYRCDVCARAFHKPGILYGHLKRVHKAQPHLKCEKCPQTFYTEYSLVYHEKVKHAKRECSYCLKQFKSVVYLKRHVAMVHMSEPGKYKCDECEKTFKLERSYVLHKQRHDGVDFGKMCTICGLKFSHLAMHLYKKHQIGERQFSCRRCGDVFDDPKTARKHGELAHPRVHDPNAYQYPCALCDKKLLTKANLDKHVKTIHTQRFQCNLCDKSFRLKQNYVFHMRGHTGERPYECQLCEMKFRADYILKRHMRTHTGEKPFKCTTCAMAFMHYNTFLSHKKMFNHT